MRDAASFTLSAPRNIGVRDSKNPDGPKLTLSPDAWRALVQRVKANGETT